MKKIMVCVTQQKSCEKLLKYAAQNATEEDLIYMVHIIKEDWKYFGEMTGSDAMEYLFKVAKEYNASVNIFRENDIIKGLEGFILKHDIDEVVMGQSRESSSSQNIIKRLQHKLKKRVKYDIVET